MGSDCSSPKGCSYCPYAVGNDHSVDNILQKTDLNL